MKQRGIDRGVPLGMTGGHGFGCHRGKNRDILRLIGLCLACALLLCSCGSRAIEAEEAGEAILTEPPALTVSTCGAGVKAIGGAVHWRYENGDRTWTSVKADSLHPLSMECLESTPVLLFENTAEGRICRLYFDQEPDTVQIRCWSETEWGNTTAAGESVPAADQIVLKEDGYIYEVTAGWDSGIHYQGTARYSFYAAPRRSDGLLPVHAGEETVLAGKYMLCAKQWDGNAIVFADSDMESALEAFLTAGAEPVITNWEDLSIDSRRIGELHEIYVFDEDCRLVDSFTEVHELNVPERGIYYVGVKIFSNGAYIPEVDEFEYLGCVYLFTLAAE